MDLGVKYCLGPARTDFVCIRHGVQPNENIGRLGLNPKRLNVWPSAVFMAIEKHCFTASWNRLNPNGRLAGAIGVLGTKTVPFPQLYYQQRTYTRVRYTGTGRQFFFFCFRILFLDLSQRTSGPFISKNIRCYSRI